VPRPDVSCGHPSQAQTREHIGHATIMGPRPSRRIMPRLIGFIPYLVVATVPVAALALGDEAVAAPTKLALMPLLALAVAWGARGARWTMAHTLLVGAIALSWLGDGAGPFFPGFETVPMMLLCFGLAHVCYIWLFWR